MNNNTSTIFLRTRSGQQQQQQQQQLSSESLLRVARKWLAAQNVVGGECSWSTRIELVAAPGAAVGEKRTNEATGGGGAASRYMRCSRRHAEIDLTLLGPDPLAAWRQCYAHCLDLVGSSSGSINSSSSSASPPFVLLLLHSDRIPPALGAVIHGFRTNVWHRPHRPIQFVFVGAFLPCAALQVGTMVVDLPEDEEGSREAEGNNNADAIDPRLRPLFQLLQHSGPTAKYPFNTAREALYRAQMFCVGLPEIVDGLVAAEGRDRVGAAVLASAQCRAEIGDWVARNRHVYHAEQIIHSFHRSRAV